MMRSIVPVRLDGIKNEDFSAFLEQVEKLVVSCFGPDGGEIARDFIEKLTALRQAATGEDTATFKEMQAADIATDEVWRGFNDEIRAGQRHPNPVRREATNAVSEIFGHYEDPTHLPYKEEYSRLAQLLEELETLPFSTLKAAAVDEWVIGLRMRYNAFISAAKAHMVESTFRDMGALKKARFAVADAYRSLTARVVVLADVENHENCIRFVDGLNEIIRNSPYALTARNREHRSLMG